MNARAAALKGGLFILPFIAANAIVGNRIEPFFSVIRPGPHTSAFEYVLLFGVIGCMPIGAFIAARPLFERDGVWRRRVHVLNGIVAALMLIAFLSISFALGNEIYRCDVLKIPNCD